ncbi:hypothetical protein RFI_34224 [Reticulomyxa filosa]|uniref:Uncharacterized protein n=1 Tax=Reticulomyxa filosa TaxID=46433 RepID=X6LNI3_RETFI|nr:hypothetical protein RFI_34224 [Reticulomyxa filosa]|eukprot:ETO03184.1 hypothetical protein RFI_34224 [Reticulomyxa filosa]
MTEDPGKAEIREILQVLRPAYASQVLTYLFDDLACDDMKGVAILSAEDWGRAFKRTDLPKGQQGKILTALNEWCKTNHTKLFDIEAFFKGDTEKQQLITQKIEPKLFIWKISLKINIKRSKEPVEAKTEGEKELLLKDDENAKVSIPRQDSANEEDTKHEIEPIKKKVEYGKIVDIDPPKDGIDNTAFFYPFAQIKKSVLFFFVIVKMPLQDNQKVDLLEAWEHLSLKQGDEVQCTYTLDKVKKLVFSSLLWKFFFHVCDVKIKVIFPRDAVPEIKKLREGDKLSFRLQFAKPKWMPVDVQMIEKAAMYVYTLTILVFIISQFSYLCLNSRKIKDIIAPREIEKKASSYCNIRKWLESPSQRQPSWEKWQNNELSKMGSDLVRLLPKEKSSNDRENEMEQVMWKKRAIQLDLVKEVVVQCICEPCQVPDSVLQELCPSRQNQDVKEGEHDEKTSPSGENEEIVKLLKIVNEFHEMTEERNFQHLLQKCDEIFLEEKTECDAQSDFVVANGYVNDNTFKIVRIYVFCHEIKPDNNTKTPIKKCSKLKCKKKMFYLELWHQMKPASDETAFLYVNDFRVKKHTSWTVDIKYHTLCTSIEIETHKCAYFVELKEQGYMTQLKKYLSNIMRNTSQSPDIFIIRHLVENIGDYESLQFAQQAMRSMAKEIQKPIKELQGMSQKIMSQFDKNEASIKLICQIIFINEQLEEQRQWLCPLQLFAVVKCVVIAQTSNIIETMRRAFWSDLEAEGFQQFMLIPCFNLLASRENVQANNELSNYFGSKNFKKVSQVAKRYMDIVETDLKIRRFFNITPKLRAEVYLMQILHSQNDNVSSAEILEFLLSNEEFMTVEMWIKLWTIQDSKCADIIYNLYKCNFERWSQFVERDQIIGALKNEQARKRLSSIFNEKSFRDDVVLSNKKFIAFISFMLKHKDIIWHNWENVLQTLDYYIDKTEMVYSVDTLMAILDVLWKHCSFDQKSVERQVKDASERVLRRLQKEAKALALWLQLFTYQTQEERKHILKEILSQMSVTTYFLTGIEKKKEAILLSEKKWSKKSLESMRELLEDIKKFVDLSLLDKIFEVIVDIPIQVEFSINDKDANSAVEEKKEDQDEESKDNEEVVDEDKSNLLIRHLGYCFLCTPWLPLIRYKSQNVKRLKHLQIFVEMSFKKLFAMVEDESITFCVCEFLERDNSEHHIRVISKFLSGWNDNNAIQNKLKILLTKYREFVRLKQLYTVVSTNYMTSNHCSERLQKFNDFCVNWDLESFPKASCEYQHEQELFQKCENVMKHLTNMKNSCVFKKIWSQYRTKIEKQRDLTFKTSMDKLYTQVNKKWRKLKQVIEKDQFPIKYLKWFEASDLNLELSLLFPKWPAKKKRLIAKSIHKKREKIKQLKEMMIPWTNLKDATKILKKYHKSNDTINDDKNWYTFVQLLKEGQKILKKPDSSIQHLSDCYDKCIKCFGREVLECVELLDLIVRYEESLVKQLATSENFTNKEHFANTMETLDNCKEVRFQQLVGALRTVNENIREYIWDANFEDTSQVAKAILDIHRRDNNFTVKFKKCCDEDLSHISLLVEEAGRFQAIRSFTLLEKAIQIGQWHFARCEQVLQEKMQTNEWLVLQIGSDKLNYDQIEQAIDCVLLGFSKEQELKGIHTLIEQFGVCKDIEALQATFWKKGGRQETDKLHLSVAEPMEVFKDLYSEWKNRLEEWQKECVILRKEYPILNYFAFNEVRCLSKKLNDIVSCDQKYHRQIFCSKFIVPFLQRIDSNLSDILSFVEKWKFEAAEGNRALIQFGVVFSDIWTNLKHSSNAYRNISLCGLEYGKPNLIIQTFDKMLSVLELFKNVGVTPRIEHILICKENTTEEEIECLLFRAITSADRFHQKQAILHPSLYCLMWPEKLPLETLERVTKLFHTLLLSQKALNELKRTPYLLAVMSTSLNNMLSQKLNPFRLSQRIAMDEQTPNLLIQQLYCNDLQTFASQNPSINRNNKPFVQLYISDQIGMGKSFKIEQDVALIRSINPKVQAVRIAFNSSAIDWNIIMEGFWRYHPCTIGEQVQKNITDIENKCLDLNYHAENLVVYHLDISSCVSDSMNTFLFELLFLQHINTTLNVLASQCFHVNTNMAFLVEMPFKLNGSNSDHKKVLHTIFSLSKLPIIKVSKETNPYVFGPEAQFAIKWMKEFFAGNLKDKDPDIKEIIDLQCTELIEIIKTNCPEIGQASPLHQIAFFKYLFNQFSSLTDSVFLRNEDEESQQWPLRFKHEVTKSVIAISTDLSSRLYEKGDMHNQYSLEESQGEDEFYLCKEWQRSEHFLYLVNQDDAGLFNLLRFASNLKNYFFLDFIHI